MPRARFAIRRMMVVVAVWGLACAGLSALGRAGEPKLATLLALMFIGLNIEVAIFALAWPREHRDNSLSARIDNHPGRPDDPDHPGDGGG